MKWTLSDVGHLLLGMLVILVVCAVFVKLICDASDSMAEQATRAATPNATQLASIPGNVSLGIADVCGDAISMVANSSDVTHCSTEIGTFYLTHGWPVEMKDLTNLSTHIMGYLGSNDGSKINEIIHKFADAGIKRGILP